MAGHLLLDLPSSIALGIVEMQMQLATLDIPKLLSMVISEWKNHVLDEVYRCEGWVLWQ
jgi:hypothetical protein